MISEDIRLRIAGIYAREDKILLVKHRKFGKEYYLLPGGGQHEGETAPKALAREWDEELNLKVEVGDFLFAGESVPPEGSGRRHVYQIVFLIHNTEGEIKLEADDVLCGVEWLPINQLDKVTIYPVCVEQIQAVLRGETPERYVAYPWAD